MFSRARGTLLFEFRLNSFGRNKTIFLGINFLVSKRKNIYHGKSALCTIFGRLVEAHQTI